jgi:hypothetical protein
MSGKGVIFFILFDTANGCNNDRFANWFENNHQQPAEKCRGTFADFFICCSDALFFEMKPPVQAFF